VDVACAFANVHPAVFSATVKFSPLSFPSWVSFWTIVFPTPVWPSQTVRELKKTLSQPAFAQPGWRVLPSMWQVVDFKGCLPTAFIELADFGSDDGEAFAMFDRPGCLNSGVQGQ